MPDYIDPGDVDRYMVPSVRLPAEQTIPDLRALIETPRRIQRKRTKGWRMPEGARLSAARASGRPRPSARWLPATPRPTKANCAIWRHWTSGDSRRSLGALLDDGDVPDYPVLDIGTRRHDLACWCPLDQPCHADVLLEIANGAAHDERTAR